MGDIELDVINRALTRISRVANSSAGRRPIEERSGIPLNAAAIAVLSAIVRHGPARLTVIARSAELEQSRTSREVQRLVAGGLVDRTVDERDRRATILVATDKGIDAHRRYVEAAVAGIGDLLASWKRSDVTTLARLLDRLADEFATVADPDV